MFDNALLQTAYLRTRIAPPPRFSFSLNSRCYRTVKNLFPEVKIESSGDTAHDALADAERQARHLIAMLGDKL